MISSSIFGGDEVVAIGMSFFFGGGFYTSSREPHTPVFLLIPGWVTKPGQN